MSDSTPIFSQDLFDFLRDLAANNNRDWFHANKGRYEESARDPALPFIAELSGPLRAISPHFRAIPKATGGSLFRIYRDTRFAKDKRPYKTNIGIQFRHAAGKDAHAPGFYLHLAPDEVFVGLGMWRPDGPTLKRVREAMVADPDGWSSIFAGIDSEATLERGGESLKRAPRGFDPDHALVEDLKRKDHILYCKLEEEVAVHLDFPELYARICRQGAPFVQWLCGAVGVPF